MKIKTLKTEHRLCTCCMEEHIVKYVLIDETQTFKGQKVNYQAQYTYCDKADEFYADETQMQDNDISLKDAYRKALGLLTSKEIIAIRTKYAISQSDLCMLLGWGGKTITRYETHQVQDRAHDTILRKIDSDPEWFISLLTDSKSSFSEAAYKKYLSTAIELYETERDIYLRRAIKADYARFEENKIAQGNASLSLDKVVDVIRYFAASQKVTDLYKVKLMKLMWYADALSYKERGYAITGLAYQSLPMGAVPIGHNSIIDLKGIPCEEIDMGETTAYHFSLNGKNTFPSLSYDEKKILDIVIKKLGKLTKNDIIEFMHSEAAYKNTASKEIISFEYANQLQI
ncbi:MULTISPECIES: type II TA system antitoxin MqsA family protein [unclassified Butyrivibrio]|uniref:type II TA system antitoxin MqsA family protein n=1 Tax=unclassified Butyrivibrio TaxID=2639466 RepID=UPI00040E88BC|nr:MULTISPECIES: type II TA system antitoxin MqsA family protein [unclassified Butyrivibrio]